MVPVAQLPIGLEARGGGVSVTADQYQQRIMVRSLARKVWTAKYGYHLAQRYARINRWRAERAIRRLHPILADPGVRLAQCALSFRVAMFAGRASLPDACKSIASFTRYAGQPSSFLLATDGTLHAPLAVAALRSAGLASPIEVLVIDETPFGLPMSPSSASHPLIKKLTLLSKFSRSESPPTLYFDSDIVFFPPAADLGKSLIGMTRPAYMVDLNPVFDPQMLVPSDRVDPPVNAGMLWFPKPLDWDRARARLAGLGPAFTPTHFTEQTAVHMAMHDSGAEPFDAARFVLSVVDQFKWADRYAGKPNVVCRHYVNTVRHKMWLVAN